METKVSQVSQELEEKKRKRIEEMHQRVPFLSLFPFLLGTGTADKQTNKKSN